MTTIEELTVRIDQLKLEMDNHPKKSEQYVAIKEQREKLMKSRLKLRNHAKKNADNISVTSTGSNNSIKSITSIKSLDTPKKKRATKRVILPETDSPSDSEDEYLETMRYLKEQEEKLKEYAKQDIIPGKPDDIKSADIIPEKLEELPTAYSKTEQPKESPPTSRLINDFMSDIFGKKQPVIEKRQEQTAPEITFANTPQNDTISRQFQGSMPTKEQLIQDIYKLQAVMGIHPTEDFKDKSYDEIQMTLRDVGQKFKAKKHNVSEMLANLHVVGYTALLNLSNPFTEEQAGFTFVNVKENAEELKPVLAHCYDDLITEDPYLGKYLMSASSGAVGLLTTSSLIAAKSFSTDEKKFTTKKT